MHITRRAALVLALCLLALAPATAHAQRTPGGGLGGGEVECPNGESGFEDPSECEEALIEQGWTQGANGWEAPAGYVDEEGGEGPQAGAGAPARLSSPSSVRLGTALARGIGFKVVLGAPSTARASLALGKARLGQVVKTGLRAGTAKLRLKLSPAGKRRLKKQVARRGKATLKLTLVAQGRSTAKKLVIRR